jgi:hypothetical protein
VQPVPDSPAPCLHRLKSARATSSGGGGSGGDGSGLRN